MAADERSYVLLIEHVSGRHPVASRDRHPAVALSSVDFAAMLGALAGIAAWTPSTKTFAPAFDYAERLTGYRADGLIEGQDLLALGRLLTEAGSSLQVAHGDPLPTNFVFDREGHPTLLDWELAGLYLPGYDLAVLWAILSATPRARGRIEGIVASEPLPVRAAFALNLGVVILRELRSHLQVAPGAWRDSRVAAIRDDWDNVRKRLLPAR